MGHPGGPHRGGGDRVRIAYRDAIRVYVWQHLTRYPETWFTAYELARVIRERYLCDPGPASSGSSDTGRSGVVTKALCYLEGRGEAARRPHPSLERWTVWRAS